MYLNIMHVTEIFPEIEIPPEESVFFDNNIKRLHLATGDLFITQGTICNSIAFVETGQLQSVITERNSRHVVAQYLKNQFVSSFNGFFNHEKSMWDVQALEPSILVIISDQVFIKLCERHVCWSLFWLKVLEINSADLIKQGKNILLSTKPDSNTSPQIEM
ncbi:MAG TPA: cyclic nucleotide-binding domain-containing protein [Cyclobacteriaceae bacterium]|nr:cyclic nucleotide-binding domain-containing protein [Cyclobacteriaceae bacterium]